MWSIGISIGVNHDVSRICFVDSNSRAVYITEKNCQLNGLERYEAVMSDTGIEEECGFTLFTDNPPYFSHYKTSELFIITAYKALKPGGRAFAVAKTSAWHHKFMNAMFGNAELINRRGYGIIKSVKYSERDKKVVIASGSEAIQTFEIASGYRPRNDICM